MSRVLRLTRRTIDLDTGEVHGHGRLRPTELAMVAYLAERPGLLVPVGKLHSEVWGYADRVVSRAAYTTASRIRALIEADPSEPRHLLAERGEGYRLVGGVWETVDPEPRALTNVPAPEGLFGRTEELAQMGASRSRLWTVVGTGGVGKTRFATEAAWRGRPPGGAWFCDLHLATTEEAIEAEVARTLPQVGRAPVPERLRQLQDVLVVLDNLDAAGPAGPAVVGRWLQQAPEARFVVTRREPLGLGAERVMRLAPLSLAEGVALLRDRVGRRGLPGLPDEVAATLWSLVDGLPLSLEIVAANVALIGTDAVVERLRGGADLPARRTDGPERHRSLDEVLRWTWDRLTPDVREAMATLAVIDGPFGLPAAEAVFADPDAATRVADLVDASLLAPAADGRFVLLSTVRNAVRRWHPATAAPILDRLLALRIGTAEANPGMLPHYRGNLSANGLCQLVARLDRRIDLGSDLAARILRVLAQEGAAEGVPVDILVSWLDRGVSQALSDEVRALLVNDRAVLHKQAGRAAEAAADNVEAADLARRSGAWSAACQADYGRGLDLVRQLRTAEAEEVVALLEGDARTRSGPASDEAFATAMLLRARLCSLAEDDEGAERCCRASIAAFRAAGQASIAEWLEVARVQLLLNLGRLDEVDAHFRSSGREPGPLWLANELCRAEVMVHTGDFAEAVVVVRHLLARKESTYHLEEYVSGLGRGARVFLRAGEAELASACLHAQQRLPALEPFGPVQSAWSRAVVALLDDGPAAAWPWAVEARELATSRGLHSAVIDVAVLQAELRWGQGDVPGAARALEDVLQWRRPLIVVPAALLLAEAWLRLGDRDRVRDLAARVLQIGGTRVGRARAHALLATCAAIDGAFDEAEDHLRHTPGVRGLGQSWLDVHRAWCTALRDGRPPDPVAPSPASPLELALQRCADELGGGVPEWVPPG